MVEEPIKNFSLPSIKWVVTLAKIAEAVEVLELCSYWRFLGRGGI